MQVTRFIERLVGMSSSESEFWESHLLSGGPDKAADPFGCLPHSNQAKKWEEARQIDAMFKPELPANEVFLCPDCDSFVIGCPEHMNTAFVRCWLVGGHCASC